MEIIVPAAYDTKHFHPVIFSILTSQRGRLLNPLSEFGVVWAAGENPLKHYYSSLSACEEIPLTREHLSGVSRAPAAHI